MFYFLLGLWLGYHVDDLLLKAQAIVERVRSWL